MNKPKIPRSKHYKVRNNIAVTATLLSPSRLTATLMLTLPCHSHTAVTLPSHSRTAVTSCVTLFFRLSLAVVLVKKS